MEKEGRNESDMKDYLRKKKYKSRQNNINGEGVRQAKEGVKKRLDIKE